MRRTITMTAVVGAVWAALLALHAPWLSLPYYWDEAGYYVPAALDFFRHGLLIPTSTLATGHTPLVMVYLGVAWRAFGFSPTVTRAAMILVATGTVMVAARIARVVLAKRAWAGEGAVWSAVLLALGPLFFAQSSMAHLDLAVALFTSLAVLALLKERWMLYAIAASAAVLSKETAIVLAPVACIFVALDARRARRKTPWPVWLALASPFAPLAVWALYYHRHTGFWTGNATYLQYNLYSTLSPIRMLLCFLRRLQEVFIAGFSWVITGTALVGAWWGRKHGAREAKTMIERRFIILAGTLAAAYLAMLSVVGGAILPRYALPVYPSLIVLALLYIGRLPRRSARGCCLLAAAALVVGWRTKPPYPFPFEDNLAYADFIRLHQQAAEYLSHYRNQRDAGAGNPLGPRILTAWPATGELATPDLGYVTRPLRVVSVDGFEARNLQAVQPGSFDLVYLYSRKWEPPGNWLDRFPWLLRIEATYFDYEPQAPAAEIKEKFHLRLLARWDRRGQWAAIYETE